MSKHILVFGATGASGLAFCELALEAGHTLTIYARTPAKLPTTISEHANVTVIKGELNDEAGLVSAVECGATIFASFAGPVLGNKGTPVGDCYAKIYPLLIANNYTRSLVLCTPSYEVPEDKRPWKWSIIVATIKTLARNMYNEIQAIGKVTTEQPADQLKWTLFRVPFLGSGEAKPVTAAYVGSGEDGLSLSRKSMGTWVLQEMYEESSWIGKSPIISN